MSSSDADELPNLAEIFGRVLQRVSAAQQPLLVAIAERLAAERYRGWANDSTDETRKAELLACARREEEIAGLVEALHPEAAAMQREILAKNPDLEELNRGIFAGRPLLQQFTIQARGERLGAATWRAFAGQEADTSRRQAFLACADLEERSALVLEATPGAKHRP